MKKRKIRRGNLQQTKQHNKRNITAQWEGSSMVQWQKNNEGGRGRRKIGKEDRKGRWAIAQEKRNEHKETARAKTKQQEQKRQQHKEHRRTKLGANAKRKRKRETKRKKEAAADKDQQQKEKGLLHRGYA